MAAEVASEAGAAAVPIGVAEDVEAVAAVVVVADVALLDVPLASEFAHVAGAEVEVAEADVGAAEEVDAGAEVVVEVDAVDAALLPSIYTSINVHLVVVDAAAVVDNNSDAVEAADAEVVADAETADVEAADGAENVELSTSFKRISPRIPLNFSPPRLPNKYHSFRNSLL